MHFWQVVTRRQGGSSWPRNHFFMGAMPLLISSRLLSFLGTSGKLPRRRCPLLSKKERYFSRSSFKPVHSIFSRFSSTVCYAFACGRRSPKKNSPRPWSRDEGQNSFRGTTQIAASRAAALAALTPRIRPVPRRGLRGGIRQRPAGTLHRPVPSLKAFCLPLAPSQPCYLFTL